MFSYFPWPNSNHNIWKIWINFYSIPILHRAAAILNKIFQIKFGWYTGKVERKFLFILSFFLFVYLDKLTSRHNVVIDCTF